MQSPWDAIKDTATNFDWVGVIKAGVKGQYWKAVWAGMQAGPVADGTIPPHLRAKPINDQPRPEVSDEWDQEVTELLRNWRFEDNRPIVRKDQPKLPPIPPPGFESPFLAPAPPRTERQRALPFRARPPLTAQEWGGLNAMPFINKELETAEISRAVEEETFSEALGDSYTNFSAWLAVTNGNFHRGETANYYEQAQLGNILDQSLIFLPTNWSNLGGQWHWLPGVKPLHYLYADMYSQSSNARSSEVSWDKGVIYRSVKIKGDNLDNWFTNDFSALGGGLAITEVLKPFFSQFEDYKDTDDLAFAIENSNIGENLKAVGYNTEASLVPESLVEFSDDDLLKIRYWQVKALEEELQTAPADSSIRKNIQKEINRIQASPLRRYKEINSLAERINWAVVTIHELIGDFPLKIRWKNSDIIQIGNDPGTQEDDSGSNQLKTVQWEGEDAKVVSFHNLSSMLRELLVESQFIYGMNQRILQQGTANLTESALARQMVIKNWHLLDVIRDWIGIATTQQKKDVQFSYNPQKPNNFDDYLTPSELPVYVEEIDLKTEEIPFSTILGYLSQAAAITHAVHTVPLDNKDKWKDYIKSKLGKFSAPTQQQTEEGEEPPEKPKDDWDNFLESVEQGFVQSAVLNPWGKPYQNRPRVRDISHDQLK